MKQLTQYVTGTEGDMVERGLVLVAIVVACLATWFAIGGKLNTALGRVNAMIR